MKARVVRQSFEVRLDVPVELVGIEMESRAFQENPEIIQEVEDRAKKSMADDGLWVEPGGLNTRLVDYSRLPSKKYYRTEWTVTYEW